MLQELPRPIIFAHRGASAHSPENTLASFELALAQGADAIELDAKLSADGHVVVFHDLMVDRTTNGHGRLKDKTFAELRALDAGSFFSEKYRGEKIPALEEVLETIGSRIFINIELTNYNAPRDDLVAKVCDLVSRFSLQERMLFSSFLASNLVKARALLPNVPRGLLALNGIKGAWARSFGFNFGDYQALHPYLKDTTVQQVQRVHRLQRRIHAWTVNLADDMLHLFDCGVDGIFTDDPQLALQVLGRST